MFVLDARDGHVLSLAFGSDATTLYTCYGLGDVHVWNLTDRTARPVVVAGEPLNGMFVPYPGGRWAFSLWHSGPTAPYMPHVLDLPGRAARPFNFAVYNVGGIAPAPDGSHFVTIGHSTYDEDRPAASPCYRLYGWRMTDDSPAYEWQQDIPPTVHTHAVAALGGDRFATVEVVSSPGQPYRTQVAIRRAVDGAPLAALDFPQPDIDQILASPDGTKLVARCGTTLRAWDATNWAKPPTSVEGKFKDEMTPPAACFHPSGDYLLLANGGPSVILYDARTWKVVRKWNWKGGALRAVAVSPDGTLAAAGGPRGTVVVWDLDL